MTDLYSFLEHTSSTSDFKADLSIRGGYITFSNSGRRGGVKYFQIGLDNILQTLKDIYENLNVFQFLTQYEETPWRNNGSALFKDPVANANSTVQTKPLFSTLSKIIIWANQPEFDGVNPDSHIILTENSLKTTILKLEEVANSFKPQHSTIIKVQNKKHQIIYYGAPGTGKSYIINETTKNESVIRTTFHPDSDYSTFVGAYKPTTIQVTMRDVSGHKIIEGGKEVKEDRIVYEFVNQAFLQAYIQAWKYYAETAVDTEPRKQYLIIEEINRGNCAQIFGDLFQLLDRNDTGFSDYPIYTDNDMRKQLLKAFEGLSISQYESINSLYNGRNVIEQVLKGEILLLPSNLYIWATMNTSDQSLFPVDSAFKRRWEWQYMPIGKGYDDSRNELNWKICIGTNEYDWWSFIEKINLQIGSTTNSEDKELGFFFCKAQNNRISAETFVGKVIFYLWNDVFKDYGFDSTIFKDTDGSTLSFDKFYRADRNGKAIVQNEKIDLFLNNLGVEMSGDSENLFLDENGNTENSPTKDFSRYSLNGNGSYSKGGIVYEAIKLYAEKNPEMSAQKIVEAWLSLSINISNLIETDEMWNRRKELTKDARFESKSKALTLHNGEIIHISNQFNVNRIENFINCVNAQNWNIRIEKL